MGAGGYNPDLQARRDAERAAAISSEDWLAQNEQRRREAKEQRAKQLASLPPAGRRPRCHQCRHELALYKYARPGDERQFGYEGNNKFCTLRCGFRWAVAHT